MRATVEALLASLMQAEQALPNARLQVSAAPRGAPLLDSQLLRRAQRMARVVIPVLCIHGISDPHIDRSTSLGSDGRNNCCVSENQGSQPSLVHHGAKEVSW